jgi:hypothetical protein
MFRRHSCPPGHRRRHLPKYPIYARNPAITNMCMAAINIIPTPTLSRSTQLVSFSLYYLPVMPAQNSCSRMSSPPAVPSRSAAPNLNLLPQLPQTYVAYNLLWTCTDSNTQGTIPGRALYDTPRVAHSLSNSSNPLVAEPPPLVNSLNVSLTLINFIVLANHVSSVEAEEKLVPSSQPPSRPSSTRQKSTKRHKAILQSPDTSDGEDEDTGTWQTGNQSPPGTPIFHLSVCNANHTLLRTPSQPATLRRWSVNGARRFAQPQQQQ